MNNNLIGMEILRLLQSQATQVTQEYFSVSELEK
jgi:hypothetical protein